MIKNIQPRVNYIHLAVLIAGVFIFGIYIEDANRAGYLRDVALEGLKSAGYAKTNVEKSIASGRDPAAGWSRRTTKTVDIDVESHTGIIIVTYRDSLPEIAGSTLVLFPLKVEKNGRHRMQSSGKWSKPIKWVCTSLNSRMAYAPELASMRGTLATRYSPAECRY